MDDDLEKLAGLLQKEGIFLSRRRLEPSIGDLDDLAAYLELLRGNVDTSSQDANVFCMPQRAAAP